MTDQLKEEELARGSNDWLRDIDVTIVHKDGSQTKQRGIPQWMLLSMEEEKNSLRK